MTLQIASTEPLILVGSAREIMDGLVTPERARYALNLAKRGLTEAREKLRIEITAEPAEWMVKALPRFWSDEGRAARVEYRQASVETWEMDVARWEARVRHIEETGR